MRAGPPIPISARPAGDRRLTAWLIAGLAAVAALRIWIALTLRVNSDEPQHLHVVWAWTQGLLPYRDLFDNHAPLFQALYAPILAAFGERADIVPLMRLAALPWFAATAWLTWHLGHQLFGRRSAWLAVFLVALEPTFLSRGVEFRPDAAWAVAWLAALVVATAGTFTTRRAFASGLLAGVAGALSIKTAVLLAAAVAAAAVVLAGSAAPRRVRAAGALRLATACAGGGVIVPAIVTGAFALGGAFEAMRYCLFVHNATSGLGRWGSPGAERWIFPVALAAFALATWRALRGRAEPRAALRVWVLGSALLYLALRASYQPLLDSQDLLPAAAMLAPYAAALCLAGSLRDGSVRRRARGVAIAAVLLLDALPALAGARPWRDDASDYTHELATLLRLTRPGEFVMDDKAESIFRPRPIYFVLENVTRYRIARGLIRDDLVARLAAHRVAVGVFAREQPEELAFVRHNYLDVAPPVAVAGQALGRHDANAPVEFDVAVPLVYAIVGEHGPAGGTLDGTDYAGPRELAAGRHVFVPRRADAWGLIWERAEALGYSPFDAAPR